MRTKVCLDGGTEERTDRCLQCWLRSNADPPSASQSRRSSAPDSLRAGFANPPEDWPAASPCDAAAVITREPKLAVCANYLPYAPPSAKAGKVHFDRCYIGL